jgi:hypothetical protein
LDATNAYWLTGQGQTGSVMTAPLDGSTAARAIGGTSPRPVVLAVTATHAYYASATGAILKAALDGSTEPETLATGQGVVNSISVDDTNVYWIAGGTISSLPL